MTGYFGTDAQQELQRRCHKLEGWMANTPGIYNAGRMIGCEAPARLGFDTLSEIFERDGVLGFRMLPETALAPTLAAFSDQSARIDRWDVLVGTAASALDAVTSILEEDGETGVQPLHADTPARHILDLQNFSAQNGVSPFPGYLLMRQPPQGVTLVQRSDNGEILALGHAYFPHNHHSRFARYAWVGMISVSERARGLGLGRHMNAALIRAAITQLGASHVTQMAARDNFASRRMIEACGCVYQPDLACAVISRPDAQRFTR